MAKDTKAKAFNLKLIRNIGVIAHIDAGKTTTTEHLLYYSGAKHKLGGVDEGTTETDYDQEEQQRGITIYSACVPFHWRDCTINLIDTPGHVDFTAEVERSLRVLDGCICVFDAQKGVEAQSETVWRQANKYGVPRLVFVNKMDVVGANFANVLASIRERLDGKPIPVVIPIGAGGKADSHKPFCGVIDLIEMKALYFDTNDYGKTIRTAEIPPENQAEAASYREALIDALTQFDEKDLITTAALEGSPIDPNALRTLIREQTIRRQIQPVLAGSGREHIGIQPLLDAVCFYLPSPLDRSAVVGQNPKKPEKEEKRKPEVDEPFCGLVFKVIADTKGELFYIRIYSGTLKANSRVFNPGKDVKENVSKLFHIYADPKAEREDLAEAYAGDIVAAIGLKDAVTGDTLCDTQAPILLEAIKFMEPVVTQSVEPQTSTDRQKMLDTLERLRREDPTFKYRSNPETGQTLISGMGTLHLEVKINRIERDFRLKLRVGKPLVSYRETLEGPKRVQGEFLRQLGGANQFAKITVDFDNQPSDPPIIVKSRIKPGALEPQFLAAAERGLVSALQSGLIGYPLLNVQATIIDGAFDPLLSNEPAFEAAANDAVMKALENNVVLLEPIMKLTVGCPEQYLGNVQAELMRRRAEIRSQESDGKYATLIALMPMAESFDLEDKIRSRSEGRAGTSLEPHSYAPAPPQVLQKMLHPEDF